MRLRQDDNPPKKYRETLENFQGCLSTNRMKTHTHSHTRHCKEEKKIIFTADRRVHIQKGLSRSYVRFFIGARSAQTRADASGLLRADAYMKTLRFSPVQILSFCCSYDNRPKGFSYIFFFFHLHKSDFASVIKGRGFISVSSFVMIIHCDFGL